jgi:hypothetical protein
MMNSLRARGAALTAAQVAGKTGLETKTPTRQGWRYIFRTELAG